MEASLLSRRWLLHELGLPWQRVLERRRMPVQCPEFFVHRPFFLLTRVSCRVGVSVGCGVCPNIKKGS